MFDILVDTRRKRLSLCMLIIAFVLFVLMVNDLAYVTGIFSCGSTSELLAKIDTSVSSFYGRMILLLLNSSIAGLHSWLAIAVEYCFILLRSLTNLEWFLVISLFLLMLSHQDRISRFLFYVLVVHFCLRVVLATVLTTLFANVIVSNDINLLLNGVHYLSLATMILHAGFIVVLGCYMYNVFCHIYVVALKKKDASNG